MLLALEDAVQKLRTGSMMLMAASVVCMLALAAFFAAMSSAAIQLQQVKVPGNMPALVSMFVQRTLESLVVLVGGMLTGAALQLIGVFLYIVPSIDLLRQYRDSLYGTPAKIIKIGLVASYTMGAIAVVLLILSFYALFRVLIT